MEVTFDVKNQIVTRTDRNRVIANSVDYLEASVTFTADWNGYDKQLCFQNGNTEIYIMLVNDAITAENHLNLGVGTWKVFLIGTKGEKRILTNSVNLPVAQSGYIGTDGPTSRVYDELLTIIQSLHTEAASEAVVRSCVEEFVGENIRDIINGYIGSDDGLQQLIMEAVEEYLQTEIDATTVNGHHVYKDVPADAKFTDTLYDDTTIKGRVSTCEDAITDLTARVVALEQSIGYVVAAPDFAFSCVSIYPTSHEGASATRTITIDNSGGYSYLSFKWSNNGSATGYGWIRGSCTFDGTTTYLYQQSNAETDVDGSVRLNVSGLPSTFTVQFDVASETGYQYTSSKAQLNVSEIRLTNN